MQLIMVYTLASLIIKHQSSYIVLFLPKNKTYANLAENVGLLISGKRGGWCWLSGRTSVFGRQTPCPAPDLQLTGKPSAAGQPTRSTQPFVLSGSINE